MYRKKRDARRGKSAVASVCALALILIAAARFHSARVSLDAENVSPSPTPSIKLELTDVDDSVSEEIISQIILELSGVSSSDDAAITLHESEPSVLIYHTHTTEAYFPTENHMYTPGSGWRCSDESMNIVAVGERLAEVLRNEYGLNVIHDATNHEPPKLSSAYSRSEVTMKAYKEKYPTLKLFIDIHRDAYGSPDEPTDYVMINGTEVARIMFVVGTGKGATGTGFDEMPDFASNYALALRLTEYLVSINPKLARNIRVKSGRYNQHISSACLLAEIGHNANTLEQALAAAEYLAEAIGSVAGLTASEPEDILKLAP